MNKLQGKNAAISGATYSVAFNFKWRCLLESCGVYFRIICKNPCHARSRLSVCLSDSMLVVVQYSGI